MPDGGSKRVKDDELAVLIEADVDTLDEEALVTLEKPKEQTKGYDREELKEAMR